jgi:acyl carrier protein
MNPTSDRAGSQASDMMPIIVATIRAISAQARAVTITPDSLLLEELALDSLDLVAVILRLQDHFQVEVDPDDIPSLRSVGDLVASLDRQLRWAA